MSKVMNNLIGHEGLSDPAPGARATVSLLLRWCEDPDVDPRYYEAATHRIAADLIDASAESHIDGRWVTTVRGGYALDGVGIVTMIDLELAEGTPGERTRAELTVEFVIDQIDELVGS